MRATVVGAGAVGARAARQLLTLGTLERLVVSDRDEARAELVARSLGAPARAVDLGDVDFTETDVAILAHSRPEDRAREALRAGAHVVLTSGLLSTARSAVALDAEARERERAVIVGAGLSPGLSCLLVLEAARRFDSVSSIEVASAGAGGPACATERRAALATAGVRWDGAWHAERGGGGRRLAAFPDPVGAKDCFAAGTAEAFLLGLAFPGARVSASVAATLLDRTTALLPRLRRRSASEEQLGAVRVEVHGHRGDVAEACVLGAIDRPALAAGAVAALAARWAADDRLAQKGAGGLASFIDEPIAFLQDLAGLGVRAAEYLGVS